MKRRSFLGLLGLAPAAPVLAKLLDTVPPPAEPVVTYNSEADQFEYSGTVPYWGDCSASYVSLFSSVSASYVSSIRYK